MRKLFSLALVLMLLQLLCACSLTVETIDSVQNAAPAAEQSVEASTSDTSAPRGYIEDKFVPAAEAEITETAIQLPMELDDGLVLESLFTSDVMKPDFGNEFSSDVATAEFVNNSDKVIDSAEITVKLSDGTAINFVLSYIPAGQTVWAFSTENAVLKPDFEVADVAANVDFVSELDLRADVLSLSVSETNIIINNMKSDAVTDALICCHCVIDNVYFGGTVYTYHTGEISAFSGAVVEAVDCMLGSPEIVYVDIE